MRVDSLIEPDVRVELRHVVEVLADETTRSPKHTCDKVADEPGYALRFPRTVTICWEKGREEANVEGELLAMYRMQQSRTAAEPPGTATTERLRGGQRRPAA